ncbi:MAG: hypothetical protein H0X24_00555 [Ktedonobacterales bacterium]|nr:hypothetical protein [Ktedonobacterales bacterium]
MAMRVWHRRHSLFGLVPQAMDPALFTCVAELATVDPEQAFRWSQHADHAWQTQQNRVIQSFAAHPRSTSVGDILQQCLTGTCLLVCAEGFTELPGWVFPDPTSSSW